MAVSSAAISRSVACGAASGSLGEDRVEGVASLFAGERAVLFGDLFQQSLQCRHAVIPCYSTGMAEEPREAAARDAAAASPGSG